MKKTISVRVLSIVILTVMVLTLVVPAIANAEVPDIESMPKTFKILDNGNLVIQADMLSYARVYAAARIAMEEDGEITLSRDGNDLSCPMVCDGEFRQIGWELLPGDYTAVLKDADGEEAGTVEFTIPDLEAQVRKIQENVRRQVEKVEQILKEQNRPELAPPESNSKDADPMYQQVIEKIRACSESKG